MHATTSTCLVPCLRVSLSNHTCACESPRSSVDIQDYTVRRRIQRAASRSKWPKPVFTTLLSPLVGTSAVPACKKFRSSSTMSYRVTVFSVLLPIFMRHPSSPLPTLHTSSRCCCSTLPSRHYSNGNVSKVTVVALSSVGELRLTKRNTQLWYARRKQARSANCSIHSSAARATFLYTLTFQKLQFEFGKKTKRVGGTGRSKCAGRVEAVYPLDWSLVFGNQ